MINLLIANEAIIRLSVFIGVFLLLAVWEILLPKKNLTQNKIKRWIRNIGLVICSTVIVRIILPTAAIGVAYLTEKNEWGFAYYFEISYWIKFIIVFVALDFIIYFQHLSFHVMPILWRFHRVHHSDMDCDVSTGVRFHPIEILLSMIIKLIAIIILGAPVLTVIIFELVLNIMSMFTHSNIYINKSFETVLRWFIVTPDMHRTHHSALENETNSNFSFNLSIWDRLFGTYMLWPEHGFDNMIIGLDNFNEEKWQHFTSLLYMPFKASNRGYSINYRDTRNEDELLSLNRKLTSEIVDKENKRRELSEALIESKRAIKEKLKALQFSEEKTNFLANMSHEIRTPLTSIIGFSEILLDENIGKSEQENITRTIIRNGKHLLQLINNILDLSKIEAGELRLESISTNLHSLCSEVNLIVGSTAKEKGLEFNINYLYPLPEIINTDPVRLKQILINLCSNAIKFTHSGEVAINISFNQCNNSLDFKVIDTGVGMSADIVNKIFSPFLQADNSITRKFGGTGLGLTISHKLVSKMGGFLTCTSQLGHGSEFCFSIKLNENVTDNLLLKFQTENLETLHSSNKTPQLSGEILLAEDSSDNQKLISYYVKNTGANLTIVANGKLAVEICLTNKFDLILMDMQMPEMDGLEATKIIRLTDTQIPIISLTENVMKSDFKNCLNAGANEFLTKPINVTRLNQILYQYLPHVDKILNIESSSKFAELNAAFLTDLPTRMELIVQFCTQQLWEQLEHETHKLIGLGKPFGFPEITTISIDINLCCRNKEFKKIPILVDELNTFCAGILIKHNQSL